MAPLPHVRCRRAALGPRVVASMGKPHRQPGCQAGAASHSTVEARYELWEALDNVVAFNGKSIGQLEA